MAVGAAGASGLRAEIKVCDGAEGVPAPAELLAVTVKVYGVPVTKPGTIAEDAGAVTVAVRPDGLEVMV